MIVWFSATMAVEEALALRPEPVLLVVPGFLDTAKARDPVYRRVARAAAAAGVHARVAWAWCREDGDGACTTAIYVWLPAAGNPVGNYQGLLILSVPLSHERRSS